MHPRVGYASDVRARTAPKPRPGVESGHPVDNSACDVAASATREDSAGKLLYRGATRRVHSERLGPHSGRILTHSERLGPHSERILTHSGRLARP
ncbi:hypothetical protein GCM10009624_08700 [Gordonia sinesedis]